MKFPLCWEGNTIGLVSVEPQGLYQRVCCAYRGPDEVLCLYAQTDMGVVYIGLCIPEGEAYGITRRIPADRLKGVTHFYLAPRGEQATKCVPVLAQEPFSALDQLEKARFFMNGAAYLVIAQGEGAL